MRDDNDYYQRRLAEETAAARTTRCPLAREVHVDLAELYRARLRAFVTAAQAPVPTGSNGVAPADGPNIG